MLSNGRGRRPLISGKFMFTLRQLLIDIIFAKDMMFCHWISHTNWQYITVIALRRFLVNSGHEHHARPLGRALCPTSKSHWFRVRVSIFCKWSRLDTQNHKIYDIKRQNQSKLKFFIYEYFRKRDFKNLCTMSGSIGFHFLLHKVHFFTK